MRLMEIAKDGGPESRSTGLFIIEIKPLFSIVFLRFTGGSREAYHNHAFDAVSWVFRGKLVENHLDGRIVEHPASWKPILTRRKVFHKVSSVGVTYAMSLRGPWTTKWMEYIPGTKAFITLTNGRRKA